LAAYLVVTLPWFIALAARAGPGTLAELIGHYTVGRYTGVIENQRGPLWYYVPVVIIGFFPWVAFIPAALGSALQAARLPASGFARLALVWTIVPFVFFSFASTKLPNYVAMILPALAILVALWFERVRAGELVRSAVISAASIPVFVAFIGVALAIFVRTNRLDSAVEAVLPQLIFLGAAMLIGSLLTVAAIARRATAAWTPYVLAATSGGLVLFIAFVAEPAAEPFKPIPPIARAIDRARGPGDLVGIHGVTGGNALAFYTEPPVRDVKRNAELALAICPNTPAWIVASPSEGDRFVGLARKLGRSAEVVATAPAGPHPRAALVHVFGAPCTEGAAVR
jgi:4-amino-4-deoxy-L-arabinose transferase-like glycosyltransferase